MPPPLTANKVAFDDKTPATVAQEAKDVAGLPRNAQNYVRAVEQMTGVQVAAVGTGPRRDQTLQLLPLLGR